MSGYIKYNIYYEREKNMQNIDIFLGLFVMPFLVTALVETMIEQTNKAKQNTALSPRQKSWNSIKLTMKEMDQEEAAQ